MNLTDAKLSKRTFIGYMAAVPVGLAAYREWGGGDFLPAAFAAEKDEAPTGPFTLPELPYSLGALSTVIDAKTMELHHGKHHKAYVDKLNAEVEKDARLKGKSMESILSNISKYSDATRNNCGGHWNHCFFWNIMSPQPGDISTELTKAISDSFGSLEKMKTKFEEAGANRFGAGWVWLIVNKEGALEITATPYQDNPLMDDVKVKGAPILGNDVWEHAYYLRYNNRRAEYLKEWWRIVNWTKVSEHYAKALKAA